MPIPRLVNPFPVNTPEWMDFCIWDAGIFHFNSAPYFKAGVPPPHELDYLHGLHNIHTLSEIQGFVASNLHASIRVTSVWLDKTQYVSPIDLLSKNPADPLLDRRELCDLAVIVRREDRGTLERSMWLLQVKKLPAATAVLPSDYSTTKEVELLEECPPFELLKRVSCPAFNLSAEFGGNPADYRHWSFLAAYDYCPPYGIASLPASLNPWQWRWLGRGNPVRSGSFSQQLLQMCAGTGGTSSNFGVRIDEPDRYPEWHRLAVQLLRFGRRQRASAAARGPHVLHLSANLPEAVIPPSFGSILDKRVGIDFSERRAPAVGKSLHAYPIKTTGFQFLQHAEGAQLYDRSESFVASERAADLDYGIEIDVDGPVDPPDGSPAGGDGGYEGGGVKCALIVDVIRTD